MSIQREKALDKGIALRAEFVNFDGGADDDNQPLYINTDCQRLKQVILNLQSNALKFTTSGSVVIRVEELETSSGQYI